MLNVSSQTNKKLRKKVWTDPFLPAYPDGLPLSPTGPGSRCWGLRVRIGAGTARAARNHNYLRPTPKSQQIIGTLKKICM